MARSEKEQRGTRKEVAELLESLERHAAEARALAERTTARKQAGRSAPYRAFRRKYDDFRALVSLIATRIGTLDGPVADALTAEFRRLDALMLALLIRTSGGFFALVLAERALPLGAREIFEKEAQLLRQVRDMLDLPEYAGRLDPELPQVLEKAILDAEEAIRQVPALPDFGSPAAT